MSTHKGSRSRVQNHEAAREAWERMWGVKRTSEPPRADTGTKSMSSSDPPKPLTSGEPVGSNASGMASTTKPSEASDKQ
jgi:hypothetical protein